MLCSAHDAYSMLVYAGLMRGGQRSRRTRGGVRGTLSLAPGRHLERRAGGSLEGLCVAAEVESRGTLLKFATRKALPAQGPSRARGSDHLSAAHRPTAA